MSIFSTLVLCSCFKKIPFMATAVKTIFDASEISEYHLLTFYFAQSQYKLIVLIWRNFSHLEDCWKCYNIAQSILNFLISDIFLGIEKLNKIFTIFQYLRIYKFLHYDLKTPFSGRMFTQRKRLLSAMTTDFTLPKHIEPNLYQRALTIFQGPAFLGLAYKFLTEVGREKNYWEGSGWEDVKIMAFHFYRKF